MNGPSSSPRGEHAGSQGARWETELRPVERVVDDEAPEPKPNRATRRAIARNARRQR